VNNTVLRKIQAQYFDQTSYSTSNLILDAMGQGDRALNKIATALSPLHDANNTGMSSYCI
jgi:hypothetical protein